MQNWIVTAQTASSLCVPKRTERRHGLIRPVGCRLTMNTGVIAYNLHHVHLSKANSQTGQNAETMKASNNLGRWYSKKKAIVLLINSIYHDIIFAQIIHTSLVLIVHVAFHKSRKRNTHQTQGYKYKVIINNKSQSVL